MPSRSLTLATSVASLLLSSESAVAAAAPDTKPRQFLPNFNLTEVLNRIPANPEETFQSLSSDGFCYAPNESLTTNPIMAYCEVSRGKCHTNAFAMSGFMWVTMSDGEQNDGKCMVMYPTEGHAQFCEGKKGTWSVQNEASCQLAPYMPTQQAAASCCPSGKLSAERKSTFVQLCQEDASLNRDKAYMHMCDIADEGCDRLIGKGYSFMNVDSECYYTGTFVPSEYSNYRHQVACKNYGGRVRAMPCTVYDMALGSPDDGLTSCSALDTGDFTVAHYKDIANTCCSNPGKRACKTNNLRI